MTTESRIKLVAQLSLQLYKMASTEFYINEEFNETLDPFIKISYDILAKISEQDAKERLLAIFMCDDDRLYYKELFEITDEEILNLNKGE